MDWDGAMWSGVIMLVVGITGAIISSVLLISKKIKEWN